MQFSVNDLKNEASESPFYFDEMVDVSDLSKLASNDIRQIEDVHVKGFVTADQEDFIFSFTLAGSMVLPCARTLVDVVYPFEIKADEVFSTTHEKQDDEVHAVDGETIDVTPYIKENIILQMPYRVFADDAVVEEGPNWSFYEEDDFTAEKNKQIDPRLKKLQQLKNRPKMGE